MRNILDINQTLNISLCTAKHLDMMTTTDDTSTTSEDSNDTHSALRPREGMKYALNGACFSRWPQLSYTLDAICGCHIPGYGSFLLHEAGDDYCIYLIFTDGTIRIYICRGLAKQAKERGMQSKIKAMVPLSPTQMVICYEEGTKGVLLKHQEEWDNQVWFFHEFGEFTLEDDILNAPLPSLNRSSQFKAMRSYGRTDFTIICSDNREIPVHSIVLASQWIKVHNLLVEYPESTSFAVDYPESWMIPLVNHFYDESATLGFMDAVNVLSAAECLGVSVMVIRALIRIKQEKMSIHQALEAWRSLKPERNVKRATAHQVAAEYCAERIEEMLHELEGSDEAQEVLADMSKQELIALYNDMSKSIGVAEEREQYRAKERQDIIDKREATAATNQT